MAKNRSAAKRARQNEKRQLRNRSIRSATKTYLTRARKFVTSGDKEAAQRSVIQAVSALDRAVTKGVLHPNNAARHKSRLVKQFNALGSPATTAG